jgi:hypothetical protein
MEKTRNEKSHDTVPLKAKSNITVKSFCIYPLKIFRKIISYYR